METEIDPGPAGDVVLLARAEEYAAQARRTVRQARALTYVGAPLSLGWALSPFSLFFVLGAAAMLVAATATAQRNAWNAAVARYGMGLALLLLGGGFGFSSALLGGVVAWAVGAVGTALLTAGYVRVLAARRAMQQAFARRNQVSTRRARRAEQTRSATGVQLDAQRRAAAAGEDLAWPSSDRPAPLPELPPWERPAANPAPDEVVVDGRPVGTRAEDRGDRRPELDPDALRPGFHGYPSPPEAPESGSDAIDPHPAGGPRS